jgi:hypothetical protein
MDRPHGDDSLITQRQHRTPKDNPPFTSDTKHELAAAKGSEDRDNVHATLQVTTPITTSLHKDSGEQNVLSVNMVNGNIDLQFYDMYIPSLIDTGATISCIRASLVPTLAKVVQTHHTKVKLRIYLADGSVCHVTKAVKLKFKIQGRTFAHQFALLPELTQPIVLGTDFLAKTSSKIEYSNDPTPKVQPIRAVRSFTIPPFSERAVTAQVTCLHSVNMVDGITDNMDRDSKFSQYLVQRSVVTPNDKNRHPLILLNISSRPCKIRKGEIIAVFTKINIDKATGTIDTQQDPPPNTESEEINQSSTGYESDTNSDHTFYVPTPDHSDYSDTESEDMMSDEEQQIHAMTEDSWEPIPTEPPSSTETYAKPKSLTEAQYKTFCQLIDDFEDIFVGKDNKLGRTHLYTHKID